MSSVKEQIKAMMRRFLIIIYSFLILASNAMAQEPREKVIKGFSGGMMLNAGWQSGCDNPHGYNPTGMTYGIGGVAKVHFTEHFRIGFEGFFSSMSLSDKVEKGSFNKIFWTGVLADWYWKAGKFYPYIGAAAGGGMETAFFMFEGDRNDWLPEPSTVYNKTPFFGIDPFIGVEYAVGDALRLTLKADWLIAINKDGLNKPTGPRIYFGFIFAH